VKNPQQPVGPGAPRRERRGAAANCALLRSMKEGGDWEKKRGHEEAVFFCSSSSQSGKKGEEHGRGFFFMTKYCARKGCGKRKGGEN